MFYNYRELLISEWNDFKIQSNVISDIISENTNKVNILIINLINIH